MQTEDIDAVPTGPSLLVTRPSQTSADSDTLAAASCDEDFARLAKARLAHFTEPLKKDPLFVCVHR